MLTLANIFINQSNSAYVNDALLIIWHVISASYASSKFTIVLNKWKL